MPLDFDIVVRSVTRTRRAVVAHESWRFGGFGAELAAQPHSELFGELEAPEARVGAVSAPVPFSPPLEAAVIPGTDDIAAAVRSVSPERSTSSLPGLYPCVADLGRQSARRPECRLDNLLECRSRSR